MYTSFLEFSLIQDQRSISAPHLSSGLMALEEEHDLERYHKAESNAFSTFIARLFSNL